MDISKFEKAIQAKAETMSAREKHAWQKRLAARGDAFEAAGDEQRAGLFAVAWMAVIF